MSKYAPRIPDRIWEQHKEAIVAFYSGNTLDQTIAHMIERYGFRASDNQYTRKLKAWGIEKYHPTRDWALVNSRKRKRGEEGKDSDVYIRGRKYSKRDVEKEIARHVRLGRDGCIPDDGLPDYITVCTPKTEGDGLFTVHRDFLLRDLPWYQCTREIEALVSDRQQSDMVPSTRHRSIELAMTQLAVRPDCDLPPLRITGGVALRKDKDLHSYLPPQRMQVEDSTIQLYKKPWDSPAFSQLKAFLQRLIYLSTNNLLDQEEFKKICDWIVRNGGENILVFLCHLRSPLMKIFADNVFRCALMSGNVSLGRKVFRDGVVLQDDNTLQRQRLKEHLSDAVYHGYEAIVELLCKAGACPEVEYGWRSDHKWKLRLPILRILLDYGADPERMVVDRAAGFPLVHAALNGSLAAVKLLVEHGSRVDNHLPMYHGTALQAAAFRDHLDVVKYLIEHGADINFPSGLHIHTHDWRNYQSTSLLTPLQIASRTNNLALLQVLLNRGASASACVTFVNPRLHRGFFYKTTETWDFPQRYKFRYEIDECIYSPVQYGVLNRNIELIATLLSTAVPTDFRMISDMQDTPLQMSARLGYVEIFQLLCTWGARMDAPPAAYNGRTAIQGAAESGNWEILLYLLRAGVDINAPAGEEHGLTALQAACVHGHTSLVGVLLAHGADPNLGPSPSAGLTAIQAAAAHGDVGTVEGLITLGADIRGVAVEGGMTALVAGVRHGSLRLLRLLVNHGADVDGLDTKGGITALVAATRYKSLPILEFLVRNGSDVNASGDYGFQSPLRNAASSDWLEGVEFLLEHGADVNDTAFERLMSETGRFELGDDLFSPLGWAIDNRSEKMVRLLVQHGADVLAKACYGFDQESVLVLALYSESGIEIIDSILEKAPRLEMHPGWEDALKLALVDNVGLNFPVRQRMIEKVNELTPLLRHQAVQRAWDELCSADDGMDLEEKAMPHRIEILIGLGASLESRAEDGSTLLMRAARYGYGKSCSFAISQGATVNTCAGELRGTPLQEAIKANHVGLANLLLDHGADINALPADNRGVTALQAASINGLFELALQLLERGADVSAPAARNYGRTAIDGAAERGHFDMVKLLLNAYGEDVDIKPVCQQAAGYAEKEKHFELARWLRDYQYG